MRLDKGVLESAPSNIALIKYMGKNSEGLATNSSFSFTLEHLRTFVRIQSKTEQRDSWTCLRSFSEDEKLRDSSLSKIQLDAIDLSVKGREKFLKHFAFLKSEFGIQGIFEVESANNFPSDCGLASSASSFAALTKAATALKMHQPNWQELAKLSRLGSGSSCRSLTGPWVLWKRGGDIENISDLPLDYANLKHICVIAEDSKKTVSSSEAHLRVSTSPLFRDRPVRAEERLVDLLGALNRKNWSRSYEIVWDEFMDMHELFKTCETSFNYMTEATLWVLKRSQELWEKNGDGPLVTMDAGANVHLLFRNDVASDELRMKWKSKMKELLGLRFYEG